MRYIEAKHILAANNGVNLYRGCSHGCIYCDARSTCYQVGDFDNIAVKKDAMAIFQDQLSRRKKRGVVNTGGMCDPYLHIEQSLKLTRQMLEIIYQKGWGVSLLTKSDMALRDLDLFKKIHESYKAIFWMTITTFDDELCKKIERNVTVTSKRLECLKTFIDHGIPCGIWLCPILPFINDTEENIKNIVEACGKIGIKYIVYFSFGTTMREGSREYFYASLDRYFPGMKQKYMKQFGLNYICPSPHYEKLDKVFIETCEKYHILYKKDEIDQAISHLHETEQLSFF